MGTGSITGYIDVAQIALYVFWAFFAGLIYYLQRESKREGYPMVSERDTLVRGALPLPPVKTYLRLNGDTIQMPNDNDKIVPLPAVPTAGFRGAPLEPTGDPMVDGIGPGSWANRSDKPEYHYDGTTVIVPLRLVAGDFSVAVHDHDPRGLPVVGADGVVGGTVSDVWVDRCDVMIRYLEVAVQVPGGTRNVLLPLPFCRLKKDQVKVQSVMGRHFAKVPTTRHPEQISLREEDQISAFYAAGTLYADPSRTEPLL